MAESLSKGALFLGQELERIALPGVYATALDAVSTLPIRMVHYPFLLPRGTPLHWAIEMDSSVAVEALLACGARPYLRDQIPVHLEPDRQQYLDYRKLEDAGQDDGSTAVDLAVTKRDPDLLKAIFNHDAVAAIDGGAALDRLGYGPFHRLSLCSWRWITHKTKFWSHFVHGNPHERRERLRATVELLVRHGFDINLQPEPAHEEYWYNEFFSTMTPLALAILNNEQNVEACLNEAGAAPFPHGRG
ncbi:hypothetical protein B0T24DRAFT_593829 [Lasiosphaeria ovina]|uniref:Ankyrin repeat protein n=1 Tax=Lasiosphaeria ovina TaxID=92902 RepID=A0AAE0N7H6_9PEZI|nr:hypothetical protein B0T24DRAFT_593829 [Lasiosphaeria ovina]